MRARPGDRAVHPHTAAEQLIKDRLAGSAGPERRRGGALPAFLFIVLLVVLGLYRPYHPRSRPRNLKRRRLLGA